LFGCFVGLSGGFLFGGLFGCFVGLSGGFLFGGLFGCFVGLSGRFLFGGSFGCFVGLSRGFYGGSFSCLVGGPSGYEILSKLPEGVHQGSRIASEAAVLDDGGVTVSKVLHRFGEFGSCWHVGPPDENRNDSYISRQGRRHLCAVSVTFVIEPTVALPIAGANPIWADHHHDDIARLHRAGDCLPEVLSWVDRVNIYKHLRGSPVPDEVLVQTSSPTC
jgi:hypothetical protein